VSESPIDIAVHGADGRMGRALLHAAAGRGDVRVVAALVRPGSAAVGEALGEQAGGASGLRCTARLEASESPAVLVDFSGASGFDAALALAVERRMALVCGSTGLDQRQQAALDAAARTIALLWAANFSLGIAVITRAITDAAARLRDWDCEILETHHRDKRDAPSGTALALGRAVAAARGVDFDALARFGYGEPSPPRATGGIGFAVRRGGDVAGEHVVAFLGDGESVGFSHCAGGRGLFARGALMAAVWLAGRPAGRYGFDQVIDGHAPTR
jgi:4-hydroxy-tetrahydrodipicolinate reductase